MYKITLAKSAGFCFGVKRAVDRAFQLAEEKIDAVTLGPIIHNPQVVERLSRKGLKPVNSPEEIGRLPGVDPNLRETLAGGAMILRSALEFCDVYDFRLTPYGLCAGMLKSPASSFSTAKT